MVASSPCRSAARSAFMSPDTPDPSGLPDVDADEEAAGLARFLSRAAVQPPPPTPDPDDPPPLDAETREKLALRLARQNGITKALARRTVDEMLLTGAIIPPETGSIETSRRQGRKRKERHAYR